ncbi:MAG: PQQ-binding-like beta-propeller repeat protein [Dehalococcoidia bacterium]|nr:PQQ-binding-like beta-propeller repeat protein [Dehalococcoidia bacterium]
MKIPRKTAAGLLLPAILVLTAACGGIKNPEGWAAPRLDGDTTYYFQKHDHLTAITIASQGPAAFLWNFPDKNKPGQKDVSLKAGYGDPVIDGDTLYFLDYQGKLFAVDRRDGTLAQTPFTAIKGSVTGGPALAGDKLAFGTTDGHLYVLDKIGFTPAPGWPPDGRTFSDGIWSPPVYQKGTDGKEYLYVATMGGRLYKLSLADGSEVWSQPFKVSGAIADLALLTPDLLFVPSLNKNVYLVNTSDGTARNPDGFGAGDWVWTTPAFKDNVAYYGDFSGNVYALDITTLQLKSTWQRPYDAKSKVKAAPAIVDNVLVVATREPQVHFIDLNTGAAAKNSFKLANAGTVRAAVVPHDGKPLVLTTSGKLFEADPTTGIATEVVVGGPKQ